MSNEPTERLETFRSVVSKVAHAESGIVIVLTQVDPDAMGAAVALRDIIPALTDAHPPVIVACGPVGHPQNRTILNKFSLEFKPPSKVSGDEKLILVDSSSTSDDRLPEHLNGLTPSVVIDHHKGSNLPHEGDEHFYWIDQEAGATCTMLAELIKELEHVPSETLRLLLALGIYTDTGALVTASQRDRTAYGWITDQVDPQDFMTLLDYPLPQRHFQNLQHGLAHMERNGRTVVVPLGWIRPQDSDDLAAIADYVLRMEGVSLVFAWGIVEEKGERTVRLRVRTVDPSFQLQNFLRENFSKEAGAKTTGGRGEGGVNIPVDLGFWNRNDAQCQIEELVRVVISNIAQSE